jgi:hypothetical protein
MQRFSDQEVVRLDEFVSSDLTTEEQDLIASMEGLRDQENAVRLRSM